MEDGTGGTRAARAARPAPRPVRDTPAAEVGGHVLTDIAPRPRHASGRFYRGNTAARFHAVVRPGRELLIFGRAGGTDFYRRFRPGDRAAYAPDVGPGVLADIEPSRVAIVDGTSLEKRRIDLYQFIRLNWHRDRDREPGDDRDGAQDRAEPLAGDAP